MGVLHDACDDDAVHSAIVVVVVVVGKMLFKETSCAMVGVGGRLSGVGDDGDGSNAAGWDGLLSFEDPEGCGARSKETVLMTVVVIEVGVIAFVLLVVVVVVVVVVEGPVGSRGGVASEVVVVVVATLEMASWTGFFPGFLSIMD